VALTHTSEEVVAYAADGCGKYLASNHVGLLLSLVHALIKKADLIGTLERQQAGMPWAQRRQPMDLVGDVTPEIRKIAVSNVPCAEADLAQLAVDEWYGHEILRPVLTMLRFCPGEPVALHTYGLIASSITQWWNRSQDHSSQQDSDYRFEGECERVLSQFLIALPSAEAIRLCKPLVAVVPTLPHEVGEFIQDLISAADQAEHPECFWPLWQVFADATCMAPWLPRLDQRHPADRGLVDSLFLNGTWKAGVQHWHCLEGNAGRIDKLFEALPASGTVLHAYARFLYSIGQRSLPAAFGILSRRLKCGEARKMLSDTDTVYYIESVLKRYVYGQPQAIKSAPQVQSAVLHLLDELVEAGSSAAYRMRDDFVTPMPITPSVGNA
jgi:hypothetical protein